MLIPSLVSTIATFDPDHTFTYSVLIGYDQGDRLYDSNATLAVVHERFRELVQDGGSPPITLHAYRFEGNRGAPCWVWNALAEKAFFLDPLIDYLYQVNDDLELLTAGWAHRFVTALRKTNNIGVTGPKDLNNPTLLTQSFVHRTHLAIFGYYYPRVFKNWYSDDWLSLVYNGANDMASSNRTRWMLPDVHVRNGLAGERYAIEQVGDVVAEQVQLARERIAEYMNSTGSASEYHRGVWEE